MPFSNASVERIFLQMNLVHSYLQNCFHVTSAKALLQIQYSLIGQNSSCKSFQPTKDMLHNFLHGAKSNPQERNEEVQIVFIDEEWLKSEDIYF